MVPMILVGYAVLECEDIDYSLKSPALIILCLSLFRQTKHTNWNIEFIQQEQVEPQTPLSGEHKQNILAHSLFNCT